jgi:hypothetical protein
MGFIAGRAVAMLVAIGLIGAGAAPSLASAAGPPAPPAAAAKPPSNDNHDSARLVTKLPTTFTGTTLGATLEPNEIHSDCAPQPTDNSVWYSVTTPVAQRLAVSLAAGGSSMPASTSISSSGRSSSRSPAT